MKSDFIVFKREDVQNIMKDLNIKVDEQTKNIVDKFGDNIRCQVCDKEISIENLGNISHGSACHFFCENPTCFITYMEKIKK